MNAAKKLLVLAASALVALPLSACVNQEAAQPGGGGGEGGGGDESVTIGIKFDQPGLGLREGENYTGFDVEVAKYVAGELGYGEDQITFVESPSAQRETLLSSGQVDMIFATYSITDTRKEQVSFAGPYIIAGQDLLVRADDSSITGPDSLEGKKLCSVTGSTPAEKVKEEYPDVELQEYPNYSACVQALSTNGVDAVTTDNTILAGFAAQPQYEGQLKVVGTTFSEERYGVGIPKGDVELCEQVNTALTKMVDSGEWQTAIDETLGASGFQVDTSVNPPEFDTCA
ncbi:glutamate ABC transporter substrate-binding protein [Auraticoccus monumenti]|uniref:Amino acid ABC transporter substrate-binding protein, PAAT family n=1 Tax=Auraticoccus monumenti TaxID=675864 RepID=A0A1G7CN02_9ACTN|nr:glutamate ABC transporter substrate-binding protein [Auraticoccus monumenti]SDE40150.1 amino acid ABC transporter substrate-binding protein, PAAT family [Auraticoccus monumenti]